MSDGIFPGLEKFAKEVADAREIERIREQLQSKEAER